MNNVATVAVPEARMGVAAVALARRADTSHSPNITLTPITCWNVAAIVTQAIVEFDRTASEGSDDYSLLAR